MKECILDKAEYMTAIEEVKALHGDKLRAFSLCPYYVHPIRVAALVAKYKQSHAIDHLIIATLFHDTVEDAGHSLLEIERSYGELAAFLVSELTSDKGKILEIAAGIGDPGLKCVKRQAKTIYLSEKLQGMSSWALTIKLADRLDNVSDFGFAPAEFVTVYSAETRAILDAVEADRELTSPQSQLIRMIRSTVAIYDPVAA